MILWGILKYGVEVVKRVEERERWCENAIAEEQGFWSRVDRESEQMGLQDLGALGFKIFFLFACFFFFFYKI